MIKNCWLLVSCSILDTVISVIYFNHAADGFSHALKGTVVLLGELTVAAGACTLAAGLWRSGDGKSWLIVLNGLACIALGLVLTQTGRPLAFRTVALLIVAMAISIGIYELLTARALHRQRPVAGRWLFGLAGVSSVGFAFAFLALGFGWIQLQSGPAQTFHWLGSYFAFGAICMLGLAMHLYNRGLPPSGQRTLQPLPTA